MARTKKRSSKRTANAGTRKHRRSNPGRMRHHRRSNPGMLGNAKDWLFGGAGVLAGVVGTRAIPQMVLQSGNTGPVGYLANAATVGLLTFAAHMVAPRNRVFSASVLAGGVAAILSRAIQDYGVLGRYSSQFGLGDYMASEFVTPQLLTDGLHSAQIQRGGGMAAPTMPVNVAGAGAGVAGITGPALY